MTIRYYHVMPPLRPNSIGLLGESWLCCYATLTVVR